MKLKIQILLAPIIFALFFGSCSDPPPPSLQRIKYNNPGLEVDLGVGLWAWALPMDYDGDGDMDLLVSCNDKPYNGIYFFENKSGKVKMPVFEPAVRLSGGEKNIQVSHVNKKNHLLIPATEIADFQNGNFEKRVAIYDQGKVHNGRIRANQWKYCDYDGDGALDLIVGIGDWSDYGWDNAFNEQGQWTRGPLHGFVYLIQNRGSTEDPQYANPEMLQAGKKPIDVYGMPSPNFADFDGDGDLDLLCGEFIDTFTYFENIGSRKMPLYKSGKVLTYQDEPLRMDLEMIIPVAFDWDQDGDMDLIVGQEDGRVAFMEQSGKITDGLPQFLPPKFFQQRADEVKFGSLVTPVSYDWDDDGDEDLVCGNTAGYIGFIENLDGGDPPRWAAPRYLEAAGEVIRIQAGYNGSIQGPCEAKWGYTTLAVADWDHNGLPDIIINSIWGEILWYENTGSRKKPRLAAAKPIMVNWQTSPVKPAWNWWHPKNNQLVTQWRTTPVVIDWNEDGLMDLIMLDHEGFLSFFKRVQTDNSLTLMPGERIFYSKDHSSFDNGQKPLNNQGGLLQLNAGLAGKSGRRKICITDWDRDGYPDLLVNSLNINFMRGSGKDSENYLLEDLGMVDSRVLAGHTTSPTMVDWDKNGIPDLLVGAEDGYLYYMKNPN